MTAIAAKRARSGVTLGADSQITLTYSDGSQLCTQRAQKIARLSWGAVAIAGDLIAVQDLRELAAECDSLAELSRRARRVGRTWEALATDGTTIVSLSTGTATTAERYATAGTGAQVALGALAAGASVRRALAIASACVVGVGGEIETVTVRARAGRRRSRGSARRPA